VQLTCTGSCNVAELAVGERFGCARRGDGSVWCWGSNLEGELGSGDTLEAMPASKARPAIASAVTKLVAGDRFACALLASGIVDCWGDNSNGAIAGSANAIERAPVAIGSGFTDVATAASHGCVVLSDTSIDCWGHGGAFNTGTGPTTLAP